MSELRILAVGGCRPNFVKLGPLLREMRRRPALETVLVHTGQHYDGAMSDVFFRDLALPAPDILLEVGSGSHAQQTARVMERLEPALLRVRPDLVLVVGDVNSTVAAALTAVKLGFPVAHVEAGLRSFDREMAEEVNRVLTDAISDLLFATETSAVRNLDREGVDGSRVHLVGNVMADALLQNMARIAASDVRERLGLVPGSYALLTLHRPENVDDPASAARIFAGIRQIPAILPLVFPTHPRTRARLLECGLWDEVGAIRGLRPTPPLGYLDFLRLLQGAAFVLTDSGGVQEESTVLKVPCLTLRSGTERPATVDDGSNGIVGTDPAVVLSAAHAALDGRWGTGRVPALWDGRASRRIADVLEERAASIRGAYRSLRARTTCERMSTPVA